MFCLFLLILNVFSSSKNNYGAWTTVDVGTVLPKYKQAILNQEADDDFNFYDLGDPISAKVQVVAGNKYIFTFPDGTEITVIEQPWKNVLKITDISRPPPSNSEQVDEEREDLWCGLSMQYCRMKCPEPQCGDDQCAMRINHCCNYKCTDEDALPAPKQTLPAPPSKCPVMEPDMNTKCVGSLSCEYGEECCCGKCHASMVYQCFNGQWAAMFTDACMAAPEICPDHVDGGLQKTHDLRGEVADLNVNYIVLSISVFLGLLIGAIIGMIQCCAKNDPTIEDVYVNIKLDSGVSQESSDDMPMIW